MSAKFFENELFKTRERFNRTIGVMPLCNPRVRTKAIYAILKMGILKNKIMKKRRKEDISNFVMTRDKLNLIFNTLTQIHGGGGNHDR